MAANDSCVVVTDQHAATGECVLAYQVPSQDDGKQTIVMQAAVNRSWWMTTAGDNTTVHLAEAVAATSVVDDVEVNLLARSTITPAPASTNWMVAANADSANYLSYDGTITSVKLVVDAVDTEYGCVPGPDILAFLQQATLDNVRASAVA